MLLKTAQTPDFKMTGCLSHVSKMCAFMCMYACVYLYESTIAILDSQIQGTKPLHGYVNRTTSSSSLAFYLSILFQ